MHSALMGRAPDDVEHSEELTCSLGGSGHAMHSEEHGDRRGAGARLEKLGACREQLPTPAQGSVLNVATLQETLEEVLPTAA